MSFAEDIVGIENLTLRAVIVVLKFVGEKKGLFTIFPIGATIQDNSKRKRSVVIKTLANSRNRRNKNK